MDTTKLFEEAMKKVVCEQVGSIDKISGAELTLMQMANEVDYLRARAANSAQEMAAKFVGYARDLDAGQAPQDPTGWSTLRDITVFASKIEAASGSLFKAVSIYAGTAGVQKFRSALDALVEAKK